MALLRCNQLTLGYENKIVVENIDFEVNSGDYLYIVGENGSGKSTLMRTILRLQKPISGTLEWGEGLTQNQIGYLPQQTVVQKDFPATVYEIVISGCLNHCGWRPFYSKEERKRALEAMRKLGIEKLAKRSYRELSGGQQQRVLLARALCAAQKMLLLDEPVAGLDPKVTSEMYDIIEQLNRKSGITMIMISHDMAAAMQYASHILYIGQKQVCFESKEEFVSTQLGKTFLSGKGGAENA